MGTVPLAGGIESSEERLLDCGQRSSVVGGDEVGQGSFLLRAKTGWPTPSPGRWALRPQHQMVFDQCYCHFQIRQQVIHSAVPPGIPFKNCFETFVPIPLCQPGCSHLSAGRIPCDPGSAKLPVADSSQPYGSRLTRGAAAATPTPLETFSIILLFGIVSR